MSHGLQESLFGTRLTRRKAIQGALAVSAAGALGLRGLPALAHQATPAEGDYPELVIVATEYAFDLPTTVESGFTRLTLDNQGAMDHHAMFMRVNDDASVEDVQAALMEPAFDPVFAVSASIGGPSAAPGASGSVIADLLPGQYVLICAIPDDAGVPHYALGMQAVLEVTEGASTSAAPAAVAKVELMEMMFHGLGAEVAAGPQVWEVANVGAAIHEMIVLQMAPGITFDQVQEMILTPPEATPMDHAEEATPAEMGPPPVMSVGGVAPMNPEFTNYALFDFAPGEYFMICFVPDQATGAPHAALGMIAPFTVA
jgi:uncharacterized cupredoxin-like copper-binding protein